MVYVGQFDETQLKSGVDKQMVEQMKSESNGSLRYVKTKFVKKGKQIVGLKVWLMTSEEYMKSDEI